MRKGGGEEERKGGREGEREEETERKKRNKYVLAVRNREVCNSVNTCKITIPKQPQLTNCMVTVFYN